MYKIWFLITLTLFSLPCISQSTIYDFKVKEINSGDIDLNSFRGKKILIVNVASTGPKASQYTELRELFQQYHGTNLVVICCPSNDFNNEPKNVEELQSFFKGTGNNFFLAKKLSVKGNNISPLYEWLTKKSKNGVRDVPITSDFQKFLINSEGKLIGFFSGRVSPLIIDRALK